MGIFQSKATVSEEDYRFWSAVASSMRLGWLGANDTAKEMKACQMAIFPLLLNTSALRGDLVGLEGHLQQGADVSVPDSSGRTALHLAAGEGDIVQVRHLLKRGAEINARDSRGETALHDAIRHKNSEVVSLLRSEGAHLDTSTVELGSEMCCLAYQGDHEQMLVWKHAGVSLNFADELGRTPLHVAVCSNQPDMVQFCLRNGSSLETQDCFNNTPMDEAARRGLHGLTELMHAEGCQQSITSLEEEMTKALDELFGLGHSHSHT